MIFSMLEKDARSSFYMAAKIAKIWFKNGPKSISKSILNDFTSSTAQGSGGSFNNREPIGEVGCCGSRMAERIH